MPGSQLKASFCDITFAYIAAEEIATIYELAVAQHKNNEEFLSHLFMAYVRIGNNLKQQKVCMILFMHIAFNQSQLWFFKNIFLAPSIELNCLQEDATDASDCSSNLYSQWANTYVKRVISYAEFQRKES